MPQHVGIVGCSAEGAALCYRTLCLEAESLFGRYEHPQVTLHTHCLANYLRHIRADDWDAVGNLMLDSAARLARAGADFLICPDNTIHQALPAIRPRLPLPWLHIADSVAAAAKARGFRKLALTGTRFLVQSEVYPQKLTEHGLAFLRPHAAEREAIDRIIMEELVRGILSSAAVDTFQQVLRRMQEAGCDAVVLGCTEIPLLMNDDNSPLPTLDSTRLLARAALQRAAAGPAA